MVFLLIIIFIVIILFDVPEMIKKEYWRELKVYSVFLIIAFTMSIFLVTGLPIPNPVKGMEYVVKDILHLNYK
ncbi:MAG: hypothetical protein Q8936_17310 [Bacillota bacterium]|nr:hypothetical protein [Bacillota bacterium]